MKRLLSLLAILLAFAMFAAACGDDDDTTADDAADDAADDGDAADDAADDGDDTADDTADDGDDMADDDMADDGDDMADDDMADDATDALDANGDGEVRIGIAAQGPRDDGGYYQALVDQAEQLSVENGFGEVIVVDNITQEESATELDNLANQPVDIILVGASGLAGSLADLAEQYSDIYWYCNCGAGFETSDFFSQTQDEGSGIHYTAGVAFGLLLQESGGDSVAMIGCCDLPFEKEALLATELGLQSVDPAFTISYTGSGAFPFDFDNVANATSVFDSAVAAGADAIYPFLGGALEPVAQLAVDAGLIVANPGSSGACGADIPYDIAIRFDGGDYVAAVFPDIVAGDFPEGTVRVFTVGTDPDTVGAELCDGTAEQQAELDEAFALVASGDLDAEIGAIKGEAFS